LAVAHAAVRAPSDATVGERPSPPMLQIASEVSPYKLRLPADAAFLARPLPAEDSALASSFRERARIAVGQGYLEQLDLFPGEQGLLVSSASDGSVRVYDRDSARLLGKFGSPAAEPFARFGVLAWPELEPDGTPLFVRADGNGLALFSATTGVRRASLDSRTSRVLRWSADHDVLVAAASDLQSQTSRLYFFRRTGFALTLLGELGFDERVDGWDLSRDNRLLALSLYPSGTLWVIDLQEGADVLRIPSPKFASDVALSPDGRFLAVGGQGLLVVDLVTPDRRAFYSYLSNNIGCVRFSPGGKLLAASAYDGRVRLFQLVEPDAAASSPSARLRLELQLRAELRHTGQSNVYALVFEADGRGLLSASGDQTVRWFRATDPNLALPQAALHFRTLEQRRHDSPRSAASSAIPEQPVVDGHYQPTALRGEPRPTRMRLGRYACRITSIYRLRDCSVTKDPRGHTLLEFAPDNLLAVKGVVYDDGNAVRFEGWLTEPSDLIDCNGCERQPIHGLLRGQGQRFRGVLTFRNYFDPYVPPEPPAIDVKVEEAEDRYPIELYYKE
jgi:hypothetical protein